MLHPGAEGSVQLVPPLPLGTWNPPLAPVCFSFFQFWLGTCCEILYVLYTYFPPSSARLQMADADALNAGDPHTFVSTENAGGGEIDPHTSLSACLGVAEMSWQVRCLRLGNNSCRGVRVPP